VTADPAAVERLLRDRERQLGTRAVRPEVLDRIAALLATPPDRGVAGDAA
jgi:hypothetical protein